MTKYEVKMAGYWPRSFFASLSVSVHKNAKKPSWPHTWSITHMISFCPYLTKPILCSMCISNPHVHNRSQKPRSQPDFLYEHIYKYLREEIRDVRNWASPVEQTRVLWRGQLRDLIKRDENVRTQMNTPVRDDRDEPFWQNSFAFPTYIIFVLHELPLQKYPN